ncbi:NACHT domain-containing protein [Candidatus Woesearchaeota archaeon]|nr:MAG: hypothetical protein COT47_02180 [Candidatus Woesearchaeota archaeon CG08_land_8_20_14_0_20_43_7]RJQ15763.1 MAG: NACHT domain-containing protein [Candidatus Woesearchaeota archaeon]
MALFKNMLQSGESLVKNEQVLDFDYQPKLVKFRESQQFAIADCIKPLFNSKNGSNVLVFGSSGIGKTLACNHVITELEQETDLIIPVYVNCWENNTTYKVALCICQQLDYPFTQNKKGIELFEVIAENMNQKSAVFIFDEIDKAEDLDFLYFINQKILRNCIVLITNYKDKLFDMDTRLRSRLFLDIIEFKKYTLEETEGILKERIAYAFFPEAWSNEAVELACQKTFELGDIRCGLLMLKKAGKTAEDEGALKVEPCHIEKILSKVDKYSVKGSSDLDKETRDILHLIKENGGKTTTELYELFQKNGGTSVYRTFYRKIKTLEMNKYLLVEKVFGGKNGNTSTVQYMK